MRRETLNVGSINRPSARWAHEVAPTGSAESDRVWSCGRSRQMGSYVSGAVPRTNCTVICRLPRRTARVSVSPG